MGKKINNDALVIKRLISEGMKQAKIAKLLGLKRQKVSYWANKPITEKKRKKKLSQFYIDKIIKLAKSKPTNSMSCRRIAYIMNSIFNKLRIKSNDKQMKISFKTVSNYLNEVFGKHKKIRKVFFLSEENKKQRITFCQNILNKLEKNDFIMFKKI